MKPVWLWELLSILSSVALTTGALALSLAAGLAIWKLTNSNPWVIVIAASCFLFLVIIPLRLWYVTMCARDRSERSGDTG
jgi:putative Mn2+ efflux pump MntP